MEISTAEKPKLMTNNTSGITTEQIFNLRILCEKSPQHHQDLYHVFINFKKAFDRVWHAALLATMKKHNISANLIRVIQTSMTRPLVQSSSTAA